MPETRAPAMLRPSPQRPGRPLTSAGEGPARILLADDDRILLEVGRAHLADPAVEVEVAVDGLAALELLRHARFDLALIDLEMPRLNGFDLIKRIRLESRLKDMTIVVITGRGDLASIELAYTLGATSFVKKPIHWTLLKYKVFEMLRLAEQDQARSPVNLKALGRHRP